MRLKTIKTTVNGYPVIITRYLEDAGTEAISFSIEKPDVQNIKFFDSNERDESRAIPLIEKFLEEKGVDVKAIDLKY